VSTAPPRVERNRRMTTETGLLLVPLLLLAGATGLATHGGQPLLHLAVGLILVPPLVLKLATAGYRFARYHLGDAGYVAAGPPAPGLRPIAPPLVLAVLVLMISGLALWLEPSTGPVRVWQAVHKLSFLVFGACVGVPVLIHLLRTPRLDLERRLPGGVLRALYRAASVVLGLALAAAGLALHA
jgi:hypothetical protein